MSKLLWDIFKTTPVILGASLFAVNSSIAAQTSAADTISQQTPDAAPSEFIVDPLADSTLAQAVPPSETDANQSNSEILEQINHYNSGSNSSGSDSDPMAQVTNVSQLRDVSPTDWAYQALRELVERYNCIIGYPDRTFRGNRATSRYEFAAGLNACLNMIERLLQENVRILREDIDKLQRLAQEFEAELIALGARIDNLEGRVAFLEDHQFSTTTKLKGEVIFAFIAQGSGNSRKLDGTDDDGDGIIDGVDDQATFSDRVRLNLDSSFTGKDRLRVRLQARNVPRLDRAFGTDMARVGFDGADNNDLEVDDVYYRFPAGDRFTFWVGPNGVDIDNIFDPGNPFLESSGTGALSRFNRRNPLVYRGPEGAGGGVQYEFSDKVSATVLYLAENDDAPDPRRGRGVFNGSFSTGIQLDYSPFNNLDLAVTFMHAHERKGEVNLTSTTGSRLRNPLANAIGFAGSRDPFNGAATTSERVGVQGNWRITDTINWTAWFGYASAQGRSRDDTGFNRNGDKADIWTWSTNFSFIDLVKEGAVLSVAGGLLPRAARVDGGLQDPNASYILEALYKYPLTDNILITPGGYAIFNPNHNTNNDTIFVGVIRTTFKF
ncbi:MAG: iron uptake porin [Xenococcaceae cyanobacterium]